MEETPIKITTGSAKPAKKPSTKSSSKAKKVAVTPVKAETTSEATQAITVTVDTPETETPNTSIESAATEISTESDTPTEVFLPSNNPADGEASTDTAPAESGGLKGFIKRRQVAILITLGILIIAPVGAWSYFNANKPVKKVSSDVSVAKKPAPKPTTKASPLTGEQVDPAAADRPITAVVIENHPDARPQSGLSQAGVVYEALAEGGITRFLAFYLDQRPKEIGPVRSIRTYFVDWALEFNAPVAHVGGNADALDLIGPLHMKDMNEFNYGSSFYRTSDRVAPHNAYTSSDLLDALEVKLGYNQPASFTPSPRKKDEPGGTNPSHPIIDINYSYNGYQVEYKYNASCNCYDRFLAGAPHIDRNTGKQIQVKNVVVEYMSTSYGTTRIGEQTVIMGTPGSGKAIVFRDGGAVEGTWGKVQHSSHTELLDANGKDIPLDAGNTWYSIVPTDKTVTY